MSDQIERLNQALTGRYHIERELGAGGMATVYLAQDVRHDRKVALKLLRPELAAVIGADRFLAEIKVTANLQHPHILPLHDSGEADGFLFYVMPYVEGESLRDRLNREQQLPIADAVRITAEIAGALDYAHRQGIVHRDIKPENILLHDGRALVADFGIALAATNTAGGRMTETGMSLGTPQYMSPEQAMGQRDITAKSDVYALGSVAYEMLVGEPPFTGPTAQSIVARIMTEDARAMRVQRATIPVNVEAAIKTALSKLPADRFATAALFAEAIQNPAFGRSTGGTGATVAADAAAPVTRTRLSRWPVTAAAVLMLAVGIAAGMMVGRRGLVEPQVVRFTLKSSAAHPLQQYQRGDAAFALSPDGRSIVTVVQDSGGGKSRLQLRSLDQLDGSPVLGTEDAVAPFFSTDGKWIGFHTGDRKLKKVAVSGGPAITLADNVSSRPAASWGDDGTIVYDAFGNSFSRVSGAGGPATRVVADSSFALFWPAFLPGSKAVLAQRCARQCAQHDLVAVELGSGKLTVVVQGAARGWYASSGHLVYGTEDGTAIYAVAFDAKALRVTGEPIALLEGVQSNQINGSKLSLSASGHVAYLAGGSAANAHVVAVDRSGRERKIIERPGIYLNPRWSPDGKRVAVELLGRGGSHIWIYDLASGTFSQLTHEGDNLRPAWSPDGKRVAFSSGKGSDWDLMWMQADGSQPPERVAEGPDIAGSTAVSWTRDGKWILVDGLKDGSKQTSEDIFAVPTTGKRVMQPAVSSPAGEQTGTVSPDGKWIAYVSNESDQLYKVYVRPFLAPGGRFLISTGSATEPLWLSNHELSYVDNETNALVLANVELGATVRVAKRTRLLDLAPYAHGTTSWWSYDVSRDGQSFLLVRPQGSATGGADPIVVLNWVEEIKRRAKEQGGRR